MKQFRFLSGINRLFVFIFFVLAVNFSFSQGTPIPPQKAQSTDSSFQTTIKTKIAAMRTGLGNVSALQSKISHVVDSLKNNGVYQSLVDGKAIKFPYAVLPPDNPNTDYALVINSVNLTADGIKAELFMQISLSSEKRLSFIAKDVPLDAGSGGFSGDLQLILVETIDFNVGNKGYSLRFHGLDKSPQENTCFITFDCRGFKNITLDGKLNFDPESVSGYDSTESDKKDPVSLDFYVQLDKMSNLLLEFDKVPALQFSNLPGFKCEVPKLTLDLSDKGNVPGFKLPQWYVTEVSKKYASGGTFDMATLTGNLWEGVYIPMLKLTIPKKFKEGSSKKEDLIIQADDIIFDQFGISALIHAHNILPLSDKANYNGFKASIDSARINIITSSLSFAGIYGKMIIPIQGESSNLDYSVLVSRSGGVNTYTGHAKLTTDLEVSAFGIAKMGLTRAQLDFTLVAKKFRPTLELDGTLAISPAEKKDDGSQGDGVGLISVSCKKLVVSSMAPYLYIANGGSVQLNGTMGSALYNLPIQIKKVGFVTQGDLYGLNMELLFMLQNSSGSSESSGNGFQASSDFTVWAKRDLATKKFSYAKFDLNSLYINVKQGAFALEGELKKFSGDPVYYKGFCGYLKVEIIGKIKVECATIFGKAYTSQADVPSLNSVNFTEASLNNNPAVAQPVEKETSTEYRYWFVDIKAQFTPSIPLSPGIDLNSIAGGLYYNMTMSAPIMSTSMTSGTTPVGGVTCKTASGKEFKPFKGVFGVMAGIGIQSTGTGTAFNGEINFGIEFNLPGGGLRKISTWGFANVMADLKIPTDGALAKKATAANKIPGKSETQTAPPATTDGGKTAPIKLSWFVMYDFPNKTLTGDFGVYINLADVIKGTGTNNKAGSVSIMACPEYWYVYVGQPTKQLMNGVDLLGIFQFGSYMCVGTKLPNPAMAPVPDGVTSDPITAADMMGLGSGFSFGARLYVGGSGEKNLVVFKVGYTARLEAGFDFMIAKSNAPVYCVGRSEARGFDNWYALGQVYILGVVEVKAGLKSPSKKILGLAISAYLRAQLPNPSYYAGEVNIEVSFLRWKKSFGADFKKGTKCDADALNASEVSFFTDNFPLDKEGEVSVFTPIAISLDEEIMNYKFKIDANGTAVNMRINSSKSLTSLKSSNGDLSFDFRIDELKKTLYIIPHEALPEMDSITVTFKLAFEKFDGSNWVNGDAIVVNEVRSYKFKTTKESSMIEHANVTYAYPMLGMENVYSQESNKGYVKFTVNPKKSTTLNPGQQFVVAVFRNGKELERTPNVTVNKNRANDYFNFDLPFARLDPSTEYTLKIMKVKVSSNSTQTTSTVSGVQIGAVALANTDTTILEIAFTTSQFSTFTDKINSFKLNTSSLQGDIITAGILASTNEGFTDLEFFGESGVPSLVEFGNIDYGNPQVTNLVNSTKQTYSDLRNINSISVSSISNGFDIVNSQLDEFKTFISDRNATCLIQGNCTRTDLAGMSVPAGQVTMKMNYRLPGRTVANSSVDFKINLDKPIVIQ